MSAFPINVLGVWYVGLVSTTMFSMSSTGCLSPNQEAVISADIMGIRRNAGRINS